MQANGAPPKEPATLFSSPWQIAALLALPALLWVSWRLRSVVALVLLSILFAIALAPAVAVLERRRLPRSLAIALLYLSILAFAGILFFVAGNIVFLQGQALLSQAPEFLTRWQALSATNPFLAPPQTLQNALSSNSLRLVGGGVSVILAGLLILLLTYYLLVDSEKLWGGIQRLVPVDYRPMADALAREIAEKVRGYLLGVSVSGLVIGLITSLGLWLLGIPYPLLFGVLAGVLEAVPMVGPVVAAIGPILLALQVGPLYAGVVVLFFVVLQQVEDKVLVVRLQSRATGLHPLTVILSLLSLGLLFGFSGMILAIPIAAAIQASLVCLNSCFYHPNGSAAWLAQRQQQPITQQQDARVAMRTALSDTTFTPEKGGSIARLGDGNHGDL